MIKFRLDMFLVIFFDFEMIFVNVGEVFKVWEEMLIEFK